MVFVCMSKFKGRAPRLAARFFSGRPPRFGVNGCPILEIEYYTTNLLGKELAKDPSLLNPHTDGN